MTLLLARGEDLMICGGRFIREMCLGGIDLGRIEDFELFACGVVYIGEIVFKLG